MIRSLGIQGQGSLTCFAWVQNGQYVFEKTTTCDQGWQLSRPYLNVHLWLALSVNRGNPPCLIRVVSSCLCREGQTLTLLLLISLRMNSIAALIASGLFFAPLKKFIISTREFILPEYGVKQLQAAWHSFFARGSCYLTERSECNCSHRSSGANNSIAGAESHPICYLENECRLHI